MEVSVRCQTVKLYESSYNVLHWKRGTDAVHHHLHHHHHHHHHHQHHHHHHLHHHFKAQFSSTGVGAASKASSPLRMFLRILRHHTRSFFLSFYSLLSHVFFGLPGLFCANAFNVVLQQSSLCCCLCVQ